MPKEKADKLKRRAMEVVNSSHVGLKEIQKLSGSINDLSQMCPFLKFYRAECNTLLSSFDGNESMLRRVTAMLKEDLKIICKVADSAMLGIPLSPRPALPPLFAKHF